MIFRTPTYVSLFLLSLTIIFLTLHLGVIKETDRRTYHDIAALSNLNSTKTQQSASYQANQNREQVFKEYIAENGPERLSFKLFCPISSLSYREKLDRKELIETMNEVTCLMQEELYYVLPSGQKAYRQPCQKVLIEHGDPDLPNSWLEANDPRLKPMQIVCRIIADQAVYSYHTNQLFAEALSIERFVLDGHALESIEKPRKLLMSGQAAHAEFIPGKEITFKAENLKATLY